MAAAVEIVNRSSWLIDDHWPTINNAKETSWFPKMLWFGSRLVALFSAMVMVFEISDLPVANHVYAFSVLEQN